MRRIGGLATQAVCVGRRSFLEPMGKTLFGGENGLDLWWQGTIDPFVSLKSSLVRQALPTRN